MELSKNFEHSAAEQKWYQHWLDKNYFHSEPDAREPYTIVIPPPNVTGVLHMGHCLNNTIQDILIRRARMQGKNACWVPGTDHASIATEAKVVQMLREKGIAKSSLSREDFLKYAWEWKEKYGGIILQQLKKLGCSLDWERTAFTMDDDYYKSVIKVFIDLYEKGIIYRGLRMVNWDPVSKTALSDEEVIFKDIDSKLFFVKYLLADDATQFITVATTRPETILGDVAICVNPTDERYASWVGKEVIVPIINRKIPIIADEYVDAEFGTGALKITPAHDKNDNELGRKHNLKSLNTLDAEGKFTADELGNDNPSDLVLSYNGVDRFELRKKITTDIEAVGLIAKIEDYKGQVGTSERTGAIIESRLSLQWFMNMKEFLQRNPETLSAVMSDEIIFHPEKTKNTYSHWLSNIKDWCISRQLWWGQQIPAWYDAEGRFVVAETEEKAKEIFHAQYSISNAQLTQDEDCLDTWFSSWLWPMEVFKGISNPENKDAAYYYPGTTLVTGQDIIFFWVARMIMAGFEYKKEIPFKDVYFTGMVRDKQGRKMSKQLGNSPDLLEMIEKDGADAVRFGVMFSSPAGNDLMWDQSGNEQGKFFINKMWNALKLVKMWEGRQSESQKDGKTESSFAVEWFENRLAQVRLELDEQFKDFRLSESLKTIYSLIWDDFCSWYLEWVKPGFEQPIDKVIYEKTVGFFEELMQLLHPFMPFITEDIYHQLKERNEDLTMKEYAAIKQPVELILKHGILLKDFITTIRNVRAKNNLKSKDEIKVYIVSKDVFDIYGGIINPGFPASIEWKNILKKQVNASSIDYTSVAAVTGSIVNEAVQIFQCQIELNKQVDNTELKKKIQAEIEHFLKFISAIEAKLGNKNFLEKAKPEIIAFENKKKQDALNKIEALQESLNTIDIEGFLNESSN